MKGHLRQRGDAWELRAYAGDVEGAKAVNDQLNLGRGRTDARKIVTVVGQRLSLPARHRRRHGRCGDEPKRDRPQSHGRAAHDHR